MKYALTLLAALFLVGVSALPIDDIHSNKLYREFLDFYLILPLDKIQNVMENHKNDLKISQAIAYMSTDEFHNLIYTVEDLPAFQKYALGLEDAGYPMISEIQLFHEFFEMKPYVPPKESKQRLTRETGEGGMTGLAKDIIAVLPRKEIRELHEKKLEESPAFAKYNEYLHSEKYAELRKALLAQKPVVELLEKSLSHGLDFKAADDMKFYILGFK